MPTRTFPNWNEIYGQQPVEGMPWYYQELDPDLDRALAEQHVETGCALDLGTGPATQAFALAQRGYQVTASDLSQRAIELARTGAASKDLSIEFVQDDVLNTSLVGPFDFVFDRGCFHVLAPEQRASYASTVAKLVKSGGLFFLKCFSDEQPGEVGPYRLTAREIESTFSGVFEVLSIVRTIYHGTLAEQPKAFFCTLLRR